MRKQSLIFGTFTYVFFLFIAIYFFMERTAFIDIAFHLFSIFKDNDFAIQNNRFVAFITQLFPLLSFKLGIDLKYIAIFYSMSFVILNATIFYIVTTVLKSWKFGFAMILMNTIMATHTVYWIQSELQQGLSFLVLFFGLLYYHLENTYNDNDKRKLFIEGLLVILTFFLVFAHPLMIFPFTFLSLYFAIIKKERINNYLYYLFLFLFLFAVKSVFFKTHYDSNAMSGISNIKKLFPNYITLESNKKFLKYVISDYYFLPATLLFISIFYIVKKQFVKFILILGSFIFYLMLVNISYPNGADQFYIENIYLPLSVFLVFPLSFDIIGNIKPKYFSLILSVFLIIRLADIYDTHSIYTDRVNYLNNLIVESDKSESKKLIIQENEEIKSKIIMSWSTPYEIWLLSTIKNSKSSSIIITENTKDLEWLLPYKNKFITKWGAFDYSELPSKYFIFNDTTKYIIKR